MTEQLRLAMDDDGAPPARLLLCGTGGGGINAVNNYLGRAQEPVETLAVEADRRALARSAAKRKVALLATPAPGAKAWGTGGDPARGRGFALGATNALLEAIAGTDLLFLAASLGGGTGSGAAPVIANLAAQAGILTVAVVTLPRRNEGAAKWERAQAALREIRENADAVLVVENDRIFAGETAPLPLLEAFRRADEVLARAVIALTEIIHGSGYINIDFADVERALRCKGGAILGIGRGSGPERMKAAFRAALEHPFTGGLEIARAQSALVNLRGNPTAADMAAIQELPLTGGAAQDFKYGIILDEAMGDEIELTLIAAGIPLDSGAEPARAPVMAVPPPRAAAPAPSRAVMLPSAASRPATPPGVPAYTRPITPTRASLPPIAAAAPAPEPAPARETSPLEIPIPDSRERPVTPNQLRTEVITSLPPIDPPPTPPGGDPREVPAFLRRRKETV